MAQFKLAEFERPADDPFEVVSSNGDVYVLPHPKALHYDDLMRLNASANNPETALAILLGDRADGLLSDDALDGFALEAMLDAWAEHYGLGAPGEGGASPRSSSGTARPSRQTSRSRSATRKR